MALVLIQFEKTAFEKLKPCLKRKHGIYSRNGEFAKSTTHLASVRARAPDRSNRYSKKERVRGPGPWQETQLNKVIPGPLHPPLDSVTTPKISYQNTVPNTWECVCMRVGGCVSELVSECARV